MKVKRILSHLLLIIVLLFAGCRDSIESDAKKAAELHCEAMALMKKAAAGDISSLDEAKKLSEKSEKLMQELKGKYTSLEDTKKFLSAYTEAIKNCD
ncbi:MAG: hypothetical protein HUU54_03560 [Ignavibacteriaceae bacterium]|nr:hypothetical protein [Ignavibacteriaceae bacterium]